MRKQKGAVAAGHPLSAETAEAILRDGGNAFDAAVGAQFTAFIVEPVLTSLGGGGFLFAEKANGKQLIYDFFVQTPVHKTESGSLDFFPINADFGGAEQEYRIGAGSVATPGMVKGLFRIHRDLCSLPLKRLAGPAIEFARHGVKMNSFQSSIFDIVRPIYDASEQASEIFGSRTSPGELIREGEILRQPEMANLLEILINEGDKLFYEGEIAKSAVSVIHTPEGHLTLKDFRRYKVECRAPLRLAYKNQDIALNPPPATGGMLIGFALKLLDSAGDYVPEFGSAKYIAQLAEIQRITDSARIDSLAKNKTAGINQLLDESSLKLYREQISDRLKSFRGTTQISIADDEGNRASLTSSNGEGSGVMIPGTGIMLNNMLGEADLNPGGFHDWKPDRRVSSMMSPGILKMNNGTDVVFGSGGSNRIRTAILQVLLNLIDHKMSVEDAVNAPRLHFEGGKLNVEAGFDPDVFRELERHYPNQKIWDKKSLYFGGAHSVSVNNGTYSGAGDVRRGGASIVF